MIGRLVDERKAALVQKERGEQDLGLFALGERLKGPPERILRELKSIELAEHPPVFRAGTGILRHIHGRKRGILDLAGEIVEGNIGSNRALIGKFSAQKIQEGCFSPPVPTGKAEPPVAVEAKGNVFKDVLGAALVAERQIVDIDKRQSDTSS